MKYIMCIFVIFALSFEAHAYCTSPEPILCNTFYKADLVIHARVEKERYVKDSDDPEGISGHLYDLKVLKVYKGTIGTDITVYVENDSSRVILDLKKEYFVFASKNFQNMWTTKSDCGDYTGAEYSKEKDLAINALLRDKKSHFYGEMRSDKSFNPTAERVTIKVIGNDSVHEVKSDSKGRLSIDLQPGKYRVELPKDIGISSGSFTVDINKIDLAPGQCEQVEFIKQKNNK